MNYHNNNNKSIHLLLILLITLYKISTVNSKKINVSYKPTNYTIQDIENFKVETKFPCPENSSDENLIDIKKKDGSIVNGCEYHYYCQKKGNCILLNTNKSLYEISEANDNNIFGFYINNLLNINEILLPISCNEKRIEKGKCMTETCIDNSNCFSNKCINNICITNENNPTYICRTMEENSKLKVKCLLAYQEKCKNDDECGDGGICKNDNVCLIVSSESISKTKRFINIGIILSISFVIVFTCYIFRSNIKRKLFN
ncbi:hypothetical protein BCR32DRAFT_301910 [Anaeromyces robustus]|uniref:Dickkopf N-terminal cysteine-rich domain-containing protein n=1 Tax=Anaeromyces robustus TaxID=1754192 RepID=A0A1Y1WXP9_9FUNG|nr:hypothetical protein BCR32DRAFT_301910 [Anaeromyces robustus]|eukprot:ORX78222.1 hypothetical protein BCR32DRAFT_301910 [Anaeromyces robustus]